MKRIYIAICTAMVLGMTQGAYAQSQNPFHQKTFWRTADVQTVQNMLRKGVDVNLADQNGLTPLAHASMENHNPKVIEALLQAGADVNAVDADWGWTPLFLAAMNNENPKVIDTLVAYGANVNERCVGINSTPLIDAIVHNHNPKIITALLKAGANVNAHDDRGLSAMDYLKTSENQFHNTDLEAVLHKYEMQ